MSGERATNRGQSPCCGGDWRVKQIQIGGVTVGIVGLTDVLEQVYRLGSQPCPETAEELLARVKAQNWVERKSERDYREALLREYTAYWEAKTGAGDQVNAACQHDQTLS
ncbi:MAG: hypothetical protein M8467_05195 [Anaerolineae bacterium]|nr:hypothetical protein [Anaerolineae bacterium]